MQKHSKQRKLCGFFGAARHISPQTLKLLNLTLPFLLCAFLWISGAYIDASLKDPVYAEHAFRSGFENLTASLTILIGGAALIDCSIARGDFDK